MNELRCPMCGKTTPEEMDTCQFCGARLKPLSAATPVDSQPIHPGERPVKKDTAEFEKVKPADNGPIQAGEAPTKKNTAELEQALPTWLRTIREGENSGEDAEEGPGESMPLDRKPASTTGAIPDWLSGLNKAAESDEEVPDWLAGLRGGSTSQAAEPEENEAAEPANDATSMEWMSRLGQELSGQTAEPDQPQAIPPAAPAPASPGTGLPEWMQALAPAGEKEPPADDFLTDQKKTGEASPSVTPSGTESEPSPFGKPDWLDQLPSDSGEAPASEGEAFPTWLSDLPSVPAGEGSDTALPAENMPDWLDQLKEKASPSGAGSDTLQEPSSDEWLTSFESPARPSQAEGMPDWVAKLNPDAGKPAQEDAAFFGGEIPAAGAVPGETPDWLSNLKADVNAGLEEEAHSEQFEVAEPLSDRKETGPLPDWLSGIERPAEPAEGTPALIAEQGTASAEGRGAAFAMEAPDWLSKLKPDQELETASEGQSETARQNLEAAELPSWVQAMRPVEAVVDEARSLPPQGQQELEQNGPLAGLRGVLPASPGLGALRKPPAYTAKLQVSDGQQRFANYLERLVSNEAEARPVAPRQAESGRIWRWAISLLLILTIGATLVSGSPAQPTSLQPSDQGGAMNILASLPQGAPVLAAFDYDPALSGELEAVAAPVFDQLLSKGSRLTLVTTSPTGALLVERFLNYAPLVNVHLVQDGVDYNNLGYLAGGPSGIQYFAANPRLSFSSMKTTAGIPVWETAPLQGIQNLSDFSAIIILTDNADTGRSWIEQAGPYLGDKPMLLIVSAQAEPMIRPYYDSGQIAGMVTGLADAKVYEQEYGRPGLAQVYWNPLSYGMLAAELILLFGALWSAFATLRERYSRTGKGS